MDIFSWVPGVFMSDYTIQAIFSINSWRVDDRKNNLNMTQLITNGKQSKRHVFDAKDQNICTHAPFLSCIWA